jgi:ribosome biogenesis GTPase A
MYKKDIPVKNIPLKIGTTNMKPYWRVIHDIVLKSDIVIEVIDARMPFLSRNTEIEDIVKKSGKRIIIVMNKIDLISKEDLRKKVRKLKKEGDFFAISVKEKMGTKKLRDYLKAEGKKAENFVVGILGYPNTGKSSIINSLANRKKIKVSPRAGTTHGEQKIKVGNLTVIDSPGVIPLRESDEVRHVIIGSKNAEKVRNREIIACEIIKLFESNDGLKKLYSIDKKEEDPELILEEIGRKLNFLKKGNRIDEERTSIKIINDWQTGRLRLS